jgi:hypothetical protein
MFSFSTSISRKSSKKKKSYCESEAGSLSISESPLKVVEFTNCDRTFSNEKNDQFQF